MATHKGGKGQRGGEYRRGGAWSGSRDYNKPGSPGPRRSNSPWRSQPDYHKERRESHRVYANHLYEEWKKVEQDLTKDKRVLGTVEFVAKTPTNVKDEDLCNVEAHLKNRDEKPASPD